MSTIDEQPPTSPGLVMKSISARTRLTSQRRPPDVLEVYARDVVLHRRSLPDGHKDVAKREAITALSPKSRRRLVLVARNVEPLPWFGTLTYPREFPMDGERVKAHWRAYRERERREWGPIPRLWWLEFQARGAPHLHYAATGGPLGEVSPDGAAAVLTAEVRSFRAWQERAWYEVVGSGDERHLRAGCSLGRWRSGSRGLQVYVAKEAAKWVQKLPPPGFENVGRFWARSGGLLVPHREVSGSRTDLARAVRVARGAERASRRARGYPARADGGRVGLTAYDTGAAVRRYLDASEESAT